jgi:glutamate carboxypeptidase
LRDSGGTCDGNRLAAAGLPNLDSLGPRGGNLHSPDEFLLLDSLTERAKLSAILLTRLAAGEIDWPGDPREGRR